MANRAARSALPAIDNVRDYYFKDGFGRRRILRRWVHGAQATCAPRFRTGAWILPDARPLPGPDLAAFLEAGPPPVYVGFGSTPMLAAHDAVWTAVEAVRAQGSKARLARGRAGLDAIDNGDDLLRRRRSEPAGVISKNGGRRPPRRRRRTTTSRRRAGAPASHRPAGGGSALLGRTRQRSGHRGGA